jgi:hypothetical protein
MKFNTFNERCLAEKVGKNAVCFSVITWPLELGAVFEIGVMDSLLVVANFVLLSH